MHWIRLRKQSDLFTWLIFCCLTDLVSPPPLHLVWAQSDRLRCLHKCFSIIANGLLGCLFTYPMIELQSLQRVSEGKQCQIYTGTKTDSLVQKYSKKYETLLQFKITVVYVNIMCNLFLWSKLNFQHHYSSLQCHMIFRNHSNMLICCSRNISDYYQCWKQLCCPIFLCNLRYIFFFRILWWIESSKEQHLFIINVYTVTLD